jgi:glutathione S-transferase
MMITLYHSHDARSFRPLWALEELGIPYDLVLLPFPPRARVEGYLEVNPLGTVPTLFDGSVRMTESAAICQYLADRHPARNLHVEREDPAYANYLNWIHFGEATLTFPQTLVLRYGSLEPEDRRLPQIVEDYSRWFNARMRIVTAAVSNEEFLVDHRFTMADISVGYALLLAADLGLDGRFAPAVQRYWQQLQNRPGYQRARRAQDTATPQSSLPVPA